MQKSWRCLCCHSRVCFRLTYSLFLSTKRASMQTPVLLTLASLFIVAGTTSYASLTILSHDLTSASFLEGNPGERFIVESEDPAGLTLTTITRDDYVRPLVGFGPPRVAATIEPPVVSEVATVVGSVLNTSSRIASPEGTAMAYPTPEPILASSSPRHLPEPGTIIGCILVGVLGLLGWRQVALQNL